MLSRDFFTRNALIVAPELLGKILVFEKNDTVFHGVITETEAYLGVEDRASKAYKGIPTKGNYPMFLEGGHSYVYLTYGIHFLLNLTTGLKDDPQAVLIRGLDIIQGQEKAAQNRYNKPYEKLTKKEKENLSDGPGKLTQALGIGKEENALDITNPPLYVVDSSHTPKYFSSKRIGIDYAEEAKDYLWRYRIVGRDDRI